MKGLTTFTKEKTEINTYCRNFLPLMFYLCVPWYLGKRKGGGAKYIWKKYRPMSACAVCAG